MNAEQAGFLRDYFAGLIQQESATTAKVLGAVPDSGKDYKPDPKSRTAWQLTTHLAMAEVWFLQSILDGTFAWDQAAVEAAEAKFATVADVVAFYNREVPPRLTALRAMPADRMADTVDFFGAMQQARAGFLGLANNHTVHHRGQLAAYLRSMGSTVPAIYGGSADEPQSM